MLDKSIKPSSIVSYLDDFVIGQDDAKKILAVAIYSHYRKIEQSRRQTVEIAKSNVMLIGPSGTGKTLMCETLAKLIKVQFVTADATPLGQTRGMAGGSVQHGLLKITEGSPVKRLGGKYLDTTNVLFSCGGALVGLDAIMSKSHGYGFISTTDSDNANVLERLNTRVKPTEL